MAYKAQILNPAAGGTGVANNDASTLTISGAFASTFTMTNTTSVTFPTSGTLATTSQLPSLPLSPASGGTGIANNAASTLTISGNFATTLTVTGVTGVTLPTSGTLAAISTGTWTPVVAFGGASVGITYTSQVGEFSQIGNVVFYQFVVTLSAKGSSTGTLTVSLPSSAVNTTNVTNTAAFDGNINSYPASCTMLSWRVVKGTATINLIGNGVATETAIADTNVAATSNFKGSGFYFTT